MDNIAQCILTQLGDQDSLNTLDFAKEHNLNHTDVIGAAQSLASDGCINLERKTFLNYVLTEEGRMVAESGSHEFKVFMAVPSNGGIKKTDLIKDKTDEIGLGKAIGAKWLEVLNQDGQQIVVRQVEEVQDDVALNLKKVSAGDVDGMDKVLKEYKKRKLICDNNNAYCVLTKTADYSNVRKDVVSILTPEIIAQIGDDFSKIKFKSFNVAGGKLVTNANLHPLLCMRSLYVNVLTNMGFQEMPTNNYVESSFWNFDALFQPQEHPARDAHDTFFTSVPMTSTKFPQEYLHRVRQVHSNGGYGSVGYKNPWKLEEAQKNIMRTHTTAVSARMLYSLAQKEQFEPVKYFSIDRVFRNESLDATHLAEFHQVEGLIADRGLSLGHLKSVIRAFFNKLNMPKIRFKPAYNPYTEPSMEIFGYHDGLKRWIEVGNSGVFRPEMLLPMGLPEDVSVIAWGLSLERPTMIKYNIRDIRDLIGPKLNLEMVYKKPITRLDR